MSLQFFKKDCKQSKFTPYAKILKKQGKVVTQTQFSVLLSYFELPLHLFYVINYAPKMLSKIGSNTGSIQGKYDFISI